MSGWSEIIPQLEADQRSQIVDDVAESFRGRPLAELRQEPEKLVPQAVQGVLAVAGRMGLKVPEADIEKIAREVIARVGGLGFLSPLLRLDSGLTEIAVNPDGTVWVVPKGEQDFVLLPDVHPSQNDVWRAVEALLAPLGRACSEASPSVDAKLPRQEGLPGGARVKILHPVIAPGKGFPAINIRLFEPKPVLPAQLVEWNLAPRSVIDGLVQAVAQGLRILVIGGTASGKTTLLSAICNGIPKSARILKIEDPEEIWLEHPHVVTLEARPAQVGTSVTSYQLASGVDDAMRMSPRWLIVGEMRRGDAVAALFRAQMSDHPGLSTFHAEGPDAAINRLNLLLFNDVRIPAEGAKGMFVQAVDLLVQVGFRLDKQGKRRRHLVGIWKVDKALKSGNVVFHSLYQLPGEEIGERATALNQVEAVFNRISAGDAEAGMRLAEGAPQ
ncbi:MAG: ATPase, T2SS/T4P/T4SS family [Anaerolineales bacterium]